MTSTNILFSGRQKSKRAAPLVVSILLVSMLFPFILQFGPLRLSVYRIVLLVAFSPAIIALLRGRAGSIRAADITFFLLCAWAAISFTVVHGPGSIEASGMFLVETMGGYLVARVYIRDAEAFRQMVRIFFITIVCLFPFAVTESFTGRNLILEFANSILPSTQAFQKDPRWGLERVQGPFEHPILFGVYCASGIALSILVLGYGKDKVTRMKNGFLVGLTAFFSLSSGPLTGMVAQTLLLAWSWIFVRLPGRWYLLFVLFVLAWIFLEIAANRPPAAIFISLFAFNEQSAYFRLHIWFWGTLSISNHPLFGIGFNDWVRQDWMSSSIDMFWIVPGVRHGIPGLVLNFFAFFLVFLPLCFRKGLSGFDEACRLAILFCLAGLFITGWTVHFWGEIYVLYCFLVGSGVWLLDRRQTVDDSNVVEKEDSRKLRARVNRYHREPKKGSLYRRSVSHDEIGFEEGQ